ncbi:hypothetical protein [Devosia sp. 2618]|uniref:hypothetical protein n=1 Tax=Devosia sp. 2618 TaxID=3156454 RepID=UPI00339AB30D
MTDPALNREDILVALERLLAWPEMARSPQLARFLDYIVRQTLDGEGKSIKAYSIAVDVFGRTSDFDPQSDPIVRVQARRLRGLLDEYYRATDAEDGIQIRLPVGRYIPEFVATEINPAPVSPVAEISPTKPVAPLKRGLPRSWFVLAAIAVVVAVLAFWQASWGPPPVQAEALQRPTITVFEFANLDAGPVGTSPAAGLAIELVTDLTQFENIEVRYGGGAENSAEPPDGPPSDFVLTGSVKVEGRTAQFVAWLTQPRTGKVVWEKTMSTPLEDASNPATMDALSRSLTLEIANSRGPLHRVARQLVLSGAPLEGQATLYLCRVLFGVFRDSEVPEDAERASACYFSLPASQQQTAEALAATASLIAEHANPADSIGATLADRQRAAAVSLQRAIGLNPLSGFVWEQEARLHDAQGRLLTAQSDYASSVQLNPASADGLAGFARSLAFAGKLAEAEPWALAAAASSVDTPNWYQAVPALIELRDGQYAEALASAAAYTKSDAEIGPVLGIMAAQGAEDEGAIGRYLPKVLEASSFRRLGILPRLRERISDAALIAQIGDALLRAGAPAAALESAF